MADRTTKLNLESELDAVIGPATESTLSGLSVKQDAGNESLDNLNVSIVLLSRIVKLLEGSANVDIASRQKIVIDGLSPTMWTPSWTSSYGLANALAAAYSWFPVVVANEGGVDTRYKYMEQARISYGTAIRANITY